MEKLIELDNAGVEILIYSPSWSPYEKTWDVQLKKTEDGTEVKIRVRNSSLEEAIEEIYDKWVTATKGLPMHGLRQIEAAPPAAAGADPVATTIAAAGEAAGEAAVNWQKELDDEIPF